MSDTKTIRIKCPCCGTVLIVMDMPRIEEKSVTCPLCKSKSLFTKYERLDESDETRYGPQPSSDDATQYVASTIRVGRLVDVITDVAYPLQLGPNIVGRQAASSVADVQVLTSDRRMSRHHARITVTKVSVSHVVHTLSNAENKNPTKVNGRTLAAGESIILQHGDAILFGTVEMRFEDKW